MPSKIDLAYFRLRAAQREYRAREAAMLRWINERIGDDCYVSWSAGKDSCVVAHAVHSLRPETPILMVDPGVPIHWTEDDKRRLLDFARDWPLTLFPWDKFARASVASETSETVYRGLVHADMFAELTEHAGRIGRSRRITGMRAAESRNRRVLLASTRGETARSLHPIWQWTTEDVWTYIVRHEIPWLSIYDHLGPDVRNGLIGKNGKQQGRLVYLKLYYPEAFRRACELFEARDYV